MVPTARRAQIFTMVAVALLKVPASGLSNLRLAIPETAARGSDVAFNCSFNLQDDELYAVKWYRGTYEIFRHIPSETPPSKTFPLAGFNISSAASATTGGRQLRLLGVSFVNSGAYSCEVIADGSFHTLIDTKNMTVIDLPDEKPRITGVKESYGVGETIRAMCTSWQSHPPANLTWFINAEPAREEYLRKYELRKEYDLTYTSVLGLEFTAHPAHFGSGKGGGGKSKTMVLKCTSSLLSVYWQSSEVRINQEVSFYGKISPPLAKNSDAAANGGSNPIRHQRRRKGTPTMTASEKRKKRKKASSDSKGAAGAMQQPVGELTSHVLSSSTSSSRLSMASLVICLSTTALLHR